MRGVGLPSSWGLGREIGILNAKHVAEHLAQSKCLIILSFALIFYDISWNYVALDRTMAVWKKEYRNGLVRRGEEGWRKGGGKPAENPSFIRGSISILEFGVSLKRS